MGTENCQVVLLRAEGDAENARLTIDESVHLVRESRRLLSEVNVKTFTDCGIKIVRARFAVY